MKVVGNKEISYLNLPNNKNKLITKAEPTFKQ